MPSVEQIDRPCRLGDYVFIVEPARGDKAPKQLRIMAAISEAPARPASQYLSARPAKPYKAGHGWLHLWEYCTADDSIAWRHVAESDVVIRRRRSGALAAPRHRRRGA